jgi:hypothetical protein
MSSVAGNSLALSGIVAALTTNALEVLMVCALRRRKSPNKDEVWAHMPD